MCEQCWQSMMEPHLAGKLFHKGVETQHTAATYPGLCLQWPYSHYTWFFVAVKGSRSFGKNRRSFTCTGQAHGHLWQPASIFKIPLSNEDDKWDKIQGGDSGECCWYEFGKTGEHRENPKKPTLPTTVDPLAISRLDLGSPVDAKC